MLRREFLTGSTFALGAGGFGLGMKHGSARSILDYGAKPDGRTLSTKAIQRAIDEVSQAGGG